MKIITENIVMIDDNDGEKEGKKITFP